MDEKSLRTRLELAVSDEPPLGQLVANSLREGRRRIRRRRVTGAASLSAAVVVLIGVVPALTARVTPHHQQPPASLRTARATTAYIQVGNGVVPVDLATQTAGTPIRAVAGFFGTLATQLVVTPDGRSVYVLGSPDTGTVVTQIDTATKTAAPLHLRNLEAAGLAVAPDGRTVYVAGALPHGTRPAGNGVVPISTATNTAGKAVDLSVQGGWWQPTLTPDGQALYLLQQGGSQVGVIRTSDDAAKSISLPEHPTGSSYLSDIVFTPDSKTAYVLWAVYGASAGENVVVPISVANTTPLAPIKIGPSGTADCLVMAPDGRTLYVLTSHSVTPIDTATNRAEPSLSLPESAGNTSFMIGSPSGKMLYVLTSRGVVPISTVSHRVLPIIDVPNVDTSGQLIAITPDGRRIYVPAATFSTKKVNGHRVRAVVAGGVVPISTATNTAGRFINLGTAVPSAIVFGR